MDSVGERASFAAETQRFLSGKFFTARLEVLPNLAFKTRRSLSYGYDLCLSQEHCKNDLLKRFAIVIPF